MNKLLVLFLFSAISFFTQSSAIAQRTNKKYWKNYYRDAVPKKHKIINANFNTTDEKMPDGQFVQHEYYIDTKVVTGEVFYTDKFFSIKQGPCRFWSDAGKLRSEGTFENNKLSGKWVFYNTKTGAVKTISNYLNGEKSGEELIYLGKDTLAQRSIYRNGKLHGESVYFNKDGAERGRENWENGECANKVTSQTKDGLPIFKEEMPQFSCVKALNGDSLCGEKALQYFLAGRLKYPSAAREKEIEGRVIVEFVIEKNGELTGLECVHCICDLLKNSTFATIKSMPTWQPGRQNDLPVRVRMNLPVLYKLE